MMAQAFSCNVGKWRKAMIIYAGMNTLLYVTIALAGALIPVQFLISFELLIIFLAPAILIFLIINGKRYLEHGKSIDLVLLGTWISLVIILGIYYLYLITGLTEMIWEQGMWFSENDVLHIGLIIWMIYIRLAVFKHVTDIESEIIS